MRTTLTLTLTDRKLILYKGEHQDICDIAAQIINENGVAAQQIANGDDYATFVEDVENVILRKNPWEITFPGKCKTEDLTLTISR